MRVLKTLPLLMGMVMTGFTLFGQEYKVGVENASATKIVLRSFSGDVSIEGYDGSDVVITTDDEDLNHTPEKAKGLKPIYSAGTDNTGIGLSAEKNGSELRVTCLLGIGHDGHYKVKVPNHVSVDFKSDCGFAGDLTVSNVSGEVEVNTCQDVTLKNVSGPLEISTISGGINVVFTQVSKDKPISLASISGDIDVTIPASTPANLEVSNITGGVYTDFDLPASAKEGLKEVGGGRNGLEAAINGGGVAIKVTNISGNIFLRKG